MRSNGTSTTTGTANKQKHVHQDKAAGKSQATTSETIDGSIQCEGCGRRGHLRSNCHLKTHPDFNQTGLWKGCKAYRDLQAFFLRVKGTQVDFPFLHKTKRANDSDEQPAAAPTPQPALHGSQPAHGNRNKGGKKGRGKGGRVHFKDSGTYNRTDTITHLTCN